MGEYSTYIIYKDEDGSIQQMVAHHWYRLDDEVKKKFKYIEAYNADLKQHRNYVKRVYKIQPGTVDRPWARKEKLNGNL